MYQDLGILVSGTLFSQPHPPPPQKKANKQQKTEEKKRFSGTLPVSLNDKIFSCRIKNRD